MINDNALALEKSKMKHYIQFMMYNFCIKQEHWQSNTPLEHRAINPHHIVIASEAKQSRGTKPKAGLPRRFAPRNDDSYLTQLALGVL